MTEKPIDPALAATAMMLLREVAGQFDYYEKMHRQKGTLDGNEKAGVNAMWRDRCHRVLDGHTIPPEPTARAYEYVVEILDAEGKPIRAFRTWLPQEPIGYGLRMFPASLLRTSCATRDRMLSRLAHSTST